MDLKEITRHKNDIDKLSHEQMARIYRFAPSGHPYFDGRYQAIFDHFMERFNKLGGMTTEMSKRIGW